MPINFLQSADLPQNPDRRIARLFSYKRELLESARDSEEIRGIIFEQREAIAALFEEHGGEQHKPTVEIFRTLTTLDDLLKYIKPRSELEKIGERIREHERKSAERREVHERPGFYLLGDDIEGEHLSDVKVKSNQRTGKKLGNPIKVTWLQLFRFNNGGSKRS